MRKHISGISLLPPRWLSAFPDLRHIADPAWLTAVQSAQEQTFRPKTIVLHQSDPCRHLFLITQGTLRVSQGTESGREHVLYRISTGHICVLTLQSLLAGSGCMATAVAEDEVRVAAIPAKQFRDALERSADFRSLILSTLTKRLSEAMMCIEQVAFQGLNLRLACLLGQLFAEHGSRCLTITHQELAVRLGTYREVVSRLLKDFERAGCLKLRRGEIELLSAQALAFAARGQVRQTM